MFQKGSPSFPQEAWWWYHCCPGWAGSDGLRLKFQQLGRSGLPQLALLLLSISLSPILALGHFLSPPSLCPAVPLPRAPVPHKARQLGHAFMPSGLCSLQSALSNHSCHFIQNSTFPRVCITLVCSCLMVSLRAETSFVPLPAESCWVISSAR